MAFSKLTRQLVAALLLLNLVLAPLATAAPCAMAAAAEQLPVVGTADEPIVPKQMLPPCHQLALGSAKRDTVADQTAAEWAAEPTATSCGDCAGSGCANGHCSCTAASSVAIQLPVALAEPALMTVTPRTWLTQAAPFRSCDVLQRPPIA